MRANCTNTFSIKKLYLTNFCCVQKNDVYLRERNEIEREVQVVVVIKLIGMYITGALRSQQARTLLGHAMLLGSKGDHPKQPHNNHLFPFVGHKKSI